MTTTTTTAAAAWRPDQTADIDINGGLPDLLLGRVSTLAGEVHGDEASVRVPYVSDDPEAAIVAEGTAIPQGEATLDEVVLQTHKVAVVSEISNELMRQSGAGLRLTDSLQRAVVNKANREFVLAVAAASTDFVDGGTLGADLDAFSDAIADIAANGGEATHAIMPSSAWKTLSKIKSSTGSAVPLLGTGTGTDGLKPSLFGMPVVLSNAADAIYVVSKADLLHASSPLNLAVSEHAYFRNDATGLRATLRFGVGPARPNRHAKIALA